MNIEPTNWLTTKIVMFIARHTPKCHDMTRLISQEQDGPLPWSTRLKMRFHYWVCVWCRRYDDQLKLMRTALTRLPESEPEQPEQKLSDDARARMKQKLRDGGAE